MVKPHQRCPSGTNPNRGRPTQQAQSKPKIHEGLAGTGKTFPIPTLTLFPKPKLLPTTQLSLSTAHSTQRDRGKTQDTPVHSHTKTTLTDPHKTGSSSTTTQIQRPRAETLKKTLQTQNTLTPYHALLTFAGCILPMDLFSTSWINRCKTHTKTKLY